MPLEKHSLNISFSGGLDTKTDPFQVKPGKMLSLVNSIFTKGGLLQKRNGFTQVTPGPAGTTNAITTFNGNLTAIGESLQAFNEASATWVDKGYYNNVQLQAAPIVRSNATQTTCDSVIAKNGLVCTVYTTNQIGTGYQFYYQISDVATNQVLAGPTTISSSMAGTSTIRTATVGNYFIIVYPSATHTLSYIAVNIGNLSSITSPTNLSTQYLEVTGQSFDIYTVDSNLYIAWNGTDGGHAIRVCYLTYALSQSAVKVITGHQFDLGAITSDLSGASPIIWIAWREPAGMSQEVWATALDVFLATILAPTAVNGPEVMGATIGNVAITAQNQICEILIENDYHYGPTVSIPTYAIDHNFITQSGTTSNAGFTIRSSGLASKGFLINTLMYVMIELIDDGNQPTYYLIDSVGNIVSRLASGNAGTPGIRALPFTSTYDNGVSIPYLFQDVLVPVNKTTGSTISSGFYSQVGVNLATFIFNVSTENPIEVAQNLFLNGGYLWMYDGNKPVEQGFHYWPLNPQVSAINYGFGSMLVSPTGVTYNFQIVYEWTDAQGNINQSAPSIPLSVVLIDPSDVIADVELFIPTLRLTAKQNVRIKVYRWSQNQQTYYLDWGAHGVGYILYNDPTVDSVSFISTAADSSLVGNEILYTNSGVVEDIAGPATQNMALFKSRLFLVDSEDPNLIWYSKQIIESTPVEMSDLFTIFIAPTIGAQGSTGNITALSAMDDKLIIFKQDAIYYLVGTGPDNTGANNDFSDPIYITSTVGCANQNSIVLMPQGLMFQSDKGIWLLGRDLSTTYIGAPVEAFNSSKVLSALTIPGTNQVRFNLSAGDVLMYDYYYGQWGTFEGVPGISATLYQDLHTYVDKFGRVFQESPGIYLDNGRPVLLSFTTSWLNLMGLQGLERIYHFYLLGTYFTPHKLQVQIAYDYNASPSQTTLITPINFTPNWGGESVWGAGYAWGTSSEFGNIEQWRVFMQRQKCQSFQVTINEVYDPTLGVQAGEGLTLSGLNFVVGGKLDRPKLPDAVSTG